MKNIKKIKSSEIKTSDDLAKDFLKIKQKRKELSDIKRQLDQKYDQIRQELLDTTRGLGVLSLKTEAYTISRRKTTSYCVENEQKVIKTMKKMGLDPVLRLDKQLNRKSFKNNEIDGVKKVENEYIAIRENKKG